MFATWRLEAGAFNASESVLEATLKTSVASISFSWRERRASSWISVGAWNTATLVAVLDFAVRVDLEFLDAVVALVVLVSLFWPLVAFSASVLEEGRRSVWREETVESVHDANDLISCFTDSTREPGISTVTAMGV